MSIVQWEKNSWRTSWFKRSSQKAGRHGLTVLCYIYRNMSLLSLTNRHSLFLCAKKKFQCLPNGACAKLENWRASQFQINRSLGWFVLVLLSDQLTKDWGGQVRTSARTIEPRTSQSKSAGGSARPGRAKRGRWSTSTNAHWNRRSPVSWNSCRESWLSSDCYIVLSTSDPIAGCDNKWSITLWVAVLFLNMCRDDACFPRRACAWVSIITSNLGWVKGEYWLAENILPEILNQLDTQIWPQEFPSSMFVVLTCFQSR